MRKVLYRLQSIGWILHGSTDCKHVEIEYAGIGQKGQQYNIHPYRDNSGYYLLGSSAVKKLRYRLHHESRGRRGG